jgi:hypothetical protein
MQFAKVPESGAKARAWSSATAASQMAKLNFVAVE